MKKVWVGVFVLLLLLWAVVIFWGPQSGLSDRWLMGIESGLWLGVVVAFSCAMAADSRTDGDLIAGAEDEDGLVFALSTPVEDLVKKDIVIFHVLREKRR